jgi:membrane protease YdiL (CAAX protease family)
LPISARSHAVDLTWVLGAMLPTIWLLRPVSIVFAGPVGLLVAMGVASLRLKARGLTWKDVGVARPASPVALAVATVVVFVLVIVLSNAATIALKSTGFDAAPLDVDPWEGLPGNLPYLLFRLLLAWVTSFGEEFIFRGLLIFGLAAAFGGTRISVMLAIVLQACLFGYLHHATQGLAGAFSAGASGLALGIGYVAFGRNLWPVVIVHVTFNTIAVTELFLGR